MPLRVYASIGIDSTCVVLGTYLDGYIFFYLPILLDVYLLVNLV